MADKQVTEVTYDVSDAVDQLEKLDKKVKVTADGAEKSFNKGAIASKLFEKGISGLGSGSQFAARGLSGLVTGSSAAITPLLGLGAAVGLLATQLFNIPRLMADVAAGTDILNEGLERTAGIADTASEVLDNFINKQFQRKLEALQVETARIAQVRAPIQDRRDEFRDALTAHRAFYNDLNANARESVKEREDIEKTLAGALETQFLRGLTKLKVPQQIQKLLEQSEKFRGAGDFDTGERLLSKAEALADSGDNRFLKNRVEESREKLITELKAEAKARKEADTAAKAAVADQAARIKGLEAEEKQLAKLDKQLAQHAKLVRAERRVVGVDASNAADIQGIDDGVRDTNNLLEQVDNLQTRTRSALALVKDLGRVTRDVFISGGGEVQRDLLDTDSLKDLAALITKTFKDPNATIGDFVDQAPRVELMSKALADLESRPGLTTGVKFDVENLKQQLDLFEQIIAAQGKQTAAGKGVDDLVQQPSSEIELFKGTNERTDELLAGTNERAKELAGYLAAAAASSERIKPQIPSVPGSSPALQNQLSQPAAAAPAATNQNITVNATVKGGIIDAETTRTIVDLINRELRKQTAK